MENYIGKTHELTNAFTKLVLKSFDFYMKLYGVKMQVKRFVRNPNATLPSRDQMINQVYGKANTEDIYEDSSTEATYFDVKLIINKSRAEQFYSDNTDELVVYLNEDQLDLGDTLTFKRYNKTYSLKVTDKQKYEDLLFEYKLTGLKDYGTNI